ncbi:MAG: hypothetical protein K9W44_06600 [Candidatus Lokiarchaeota archaeon]|nr:hypothetical protein [Candidatus Harpocratesius repetitus]
MQIEIEYLKTPQIQVFPEPNLLFKVGQRSTINNALIGIQNHGPYDYNLNLRTFDSIKFIVIHNNDKDLQIKTLHLLNKLISRQGYYKGFKTNFRLTEVKIPESTDEFLIYNSQNDNILFDLNQKYPITAKKRGQIYFVIIVGNDHRAIENTNEYYYLKKICIENGYPCQYISNYKGPNYSGILQKMSDTRGLPYALWNLGVAIYSKSGGIPWVLNNPTHININLGIRFARNYSGNYTTGFATLFDKNGRFIQIFSNSYIDRDYNLGNDDFKKTSTGLVVPEIIAKRMIEDTISNYRLFHRELPNSISIYKLGYFGKDEQKAFISALEGDFQDYYLIEIVDNTLIRLFDESRFNKIIDRGSFIPLSNNWGLLCTTGNHSKDKFRGSEQVIHQLGTPKPLYIKKIFTKSNNVSLDSHAKDILSLTSLHYQTVTHNEIRLPAPLIFALKIAKMKKYNITPHDSLKNTPWFL